MDYLIFIFGESGQDLNSLQMGTRAFFVFFIALILFRLAGRRSFSWHAPYDNIILVTIGSVLSRAIVGASPFVPTIVACLIMCLLHVVVGRASIYSKRISQFLKGKKRVLYEDGNFIPENLRYCLVNEDEIKEELRICKGDDSLDRYESISMEGNGKISIVEKSK